jgi:hypothetical protein
MYLYLCTRFKGKEYLKVSENYHSTCIRERKVYLVYGKNYSFYLGKIRWILNFGVPKYG